MPVVLKTPLKTASAAQTPPVNAETPAQQLPPGGAAPLKTATSHSQTPSQPNTSASPLNFIKTGSQAAAALEEEEARAQLAWEQGQRPFRFWIGDKNYGKEHRLIFLDGDLDKDGNLNLVTWPEHGMTLSGKFTNLVCLQPHYCPACAADDKASLVCAFTVIDTAEYEIKKGDKKGQIIKNQRRLFIVKRRSLGVLQKIASNNGGLRGIEMSVVRTNKQAPSVGDVFMAEAQWPDSELRELMGKDKDGNWLDQPFDYSKAAPLYTADEMTKLGIGSAGQIIGNESKTDLSHKL